MSRKWTTAAGKFRALAIACLALVPAANVAGQTPQAAARDQAGFEEGMRAAQRGDLFGAATIFNTLLQQRPHDPGAYIGLAEVQVRSGHLDEADAWLLRGIAANPRNGDLVHARAHVALLQHRERAAADLLAQAITLDPNDPDSRRELADLYAGPLSQPGQALALHQAAPESEHAIGSLQSQPLPPTGPQPDRRPLAKETRPAAAIQRDPAPRLSADQYYRLGMAASARGNLAQAEQFLEKALQLRPWMGEAQTALWTVAEKAPSMPPSARNAPRPRDKNS